MLQMTPSFFKVLMDPSAAHLPLPPEFVSMYLKNKIPKDPITLKSADGKHAWQLNIKRIGKIYCFTHGWNNVVQDKQLGFGDFLVFWLVDHSTFKMLIYSPNGCVKVFPPKIDHDDDGVGGNLDNEDDDDDACHEDGHDDDPVFMSIITITHRYILRLPAHFVGLAGIEDGKFITMKNVDGHEWPLQLRLDKSYRASERYYLSRGWAKFYRNNNLSEGDKCVFKYIRSVGKLCLTKVTKKRWSQPSGESPVTRKRGQSWREQSGGADVESEDDYVEVVKRACGKPPKQKCHVVYF